MTKPVNPTAEAVAAAEEAIAQAQVAIRDSEHSLANDYLDAIDDLGRRRARPCSRFP